MITLADFKTICRLCLSKDDKRLVNLFSKTLYDENGEILVSEVVESFCKIKVRILDEIKNCILWL